MHWLPLLFTLIAAGEVSSDDDSSCQVDTDATFCGNVSLTCEESKYRSYDGSCNNLENPWWGTPYTPYRRLLCNSKLGDVEPIYDENLPNPRDISRQFFVDLDVNDPLWTLFFMQYGQIIAHDMSLTAGVAQTKKDLIACCTADGQPLPEGTANPRCAPIPISKDDPYYGPEGKTCMDFIRLETTKDGKNCTNAGEVPEPLTIVTAFMDISYLYGSDPDTAKKVREGKGGRLAFVKRKGKMLLPQNPNPEMACRGDSPSKPCYFTGDVRVNQNPQLALLHNIYMQHHNSIAGKLASVNPHWSDEILFEETRKIIIAIHQSIIYYEFLPGLLGQDFMEENKLNYPGAKGHIDDYDPTVNPGVSSEFAACAFRVFHTEIQGHIRSLKENRNISIDFFSLSDFFGDPSVCEREGNIDGLTRGMTTQPQSAVDNFVTKEVTVLLFKSGLLGLDLKAIDIQRGRDQGVCTYAKALRAFNLLDPQKFKDFEKFIKPEIVQLLKKFYKSHEDVDLCVALFLEKRLPRRLVSPLNQLILGEQFYRTRVGDRLFFENGKGQKPFTRDQLNEIRKTTSAGILCHNRNIKEMQGEAFKIISENNPLKSCKAIPKFNPLPWKETKSIH